MEQQQYNKYDTGVHALPQPYKHHYGPGRTLYSPDDDGFMGSHIPSGPPLSYGRMYAPDFVPHHPMQIYSGQNILYQ